MCSSGLKRSMPCDDLISLKDAGRSALQDEANRFLEQSSRMLLQQTESKRRCFGLGSVSEKKNPATAALEAALGMDDAIASFDPTFDSELAHISLFSTLVPETLVFNHDYFPCTKHLNKGAIPSVNSVDNVAGILSKLTTASTAAA